MGREREEESESVEVPSSETRNLVKPIGQAVGRVPGLRMHHSHTQHAPFV
jgi:hypothetical protein